MLRPAWEQVEVRAVGGNGLASLLGYTLRDISVFEGSSGKGFSATLYNGYTLVGSILDNANYKPITVQITSKPEARVLAQKAQATLKQIKDKLGASVAQGSLMDWWGTSSFASIEGLAQVLLQLRALEYHSKMALLGTDDDQHYGVVLYGDSFLDPLQQEDERKLKPFLVHKESNLGTDYDRAEERFNQLFIEKYGKTHPDGYNAMALLKSPFKWDLDVDDVAALYTRGGASI